MSLENILKISNDLEILKEFALNEEEIKKFNDLLPMTFERQIKQMGIGIGGLNSNDLS